MFLIFLAIFPKTSVGMETCFTMMLYGVNKDYS